MSGTTQKRRNPVRWLYDEYPKRYFGTMVGRETRDNIEGVKSVIRTIPDAVKNYRKLPKNFRKAREKFEEEYKRDERTEKERSFQNTRSGLLQLATYFYMLFIPFGFFLDSVVSGAGMAQSHIIFSFDEDLARIPYATTVWLGVLCYLIFSYHSFSLRNRITLNPFKFVELAIKHPSILLPMQGLDSTMERKFGDKWYTAIYKE